MNNNKRYKRHQRKPNRLRRKNLNRRNRTNNSIKNTTAGPYDVPNVKSNPIFTRVMRYQSPGTQTNFQFRASDMLGMINFATSTTTGYSIMSAVRLRRLRLIMMPDTSEVSGSTTFTWLGTYSPTNESTLFFMPGVVSSENFYPPQDSEVSWWIRDDTSTALFEINLTSAIVFMIDLEIEFTMPFDNTVVGGTTFTGATANTIVYPSLPRNLGSGRLFPVGLPTVT